MRESDSFPLPTLPAVSRFAGYYYNRSAITEIDSNPQEAQLVASTFPGLLLWNK